MNAQQKSPLVNLRPTAVSALFTGMNAASITASPALLFPSQSTVTNRRAKYSNRGIARFINPANVGTVSAPATF
jgi:hypothetical protein